MIASHSCLLLEFHGGTANVGLGFPLESMQRASAIEAVPAVTGGGAGGVNPNIPNEGTADGTVGVPAAATDGGAGTPGAGTGCCGDGPAAGSGGCVGGPVAGACGAVGVVDVEYGGDAAPFCVGGGD
eukprot:9447513-Ditylum_brightwellii.AAC.1